MFNWTGAIVAEFMKVLTLLFILAIIGFGYIVYHIFFYDHHTFKSKTPPSVNYELKVRDKTVDTVWIYHFD